MKPDCKEIEKQLSESRREFWAADATINNLELRLAEMAAQLANAENKCAAPVSVPAERAAFETFMEKRFNDCIDRRLVKNGDGEYFAWDMQVSWIVWQGRAAMLQAGDSTVIPDGWALVPKEITCAMDDAAWEAYHETRCMSDIWAALIAAAPKQGVNRG